MKNDKLLLLGFLHEYEAICRKYRLIASAYGWNITSECVKETDADDITEHIDDLRNEGIMFKKKEK